MSRRTRASGTAARTESGNDSDLVGRLLFDGVQKLKAYVHHDWRGFAQFKSGALDAAGVGSGFAHEPPGDEQGRVAEGEKRENGHIEALRIGSDDKHVVVMGFALKGSAVESPGRPLKSPLQTVPAGEFAPAP